MATQTLTVTYRDHDRYVVDAEVDGRNYRFYFDNPDVEEELLWILLDAEHRGIYPEARYAILDNVRAAIANLSDKYEFDWAPFMPAEAACDAPYDEPAYPPGTLGHELQQFRAVDRPPRLSEYFAAVCWMGAVACPWVALVVVCRWVGVL
jgi:hypothetical protein